MFDVLSLNLEHMSDVLSSGSNYVLSTVLKFWKNDVLSICPGIYLYLYTHTYIYIYIYLYLIHTYIYNIFYVCVCIYLFLYLHIYIWPTHSSAESMDRMGKPPVCGPLGPRGAFFHI